MGGCTLALRRDSGAALLFATSAASATGASTTGGPTTTSSSLISCSIPIFCGTSDGQRANVRVVPLTPERIHVFGGAVSNQEIPHRPEAGLAKGEFLPALEDQLPGGSMKVGVSAFVNTGLWHTLSRRERLDCRSRIEH